MRRTMVGVVLGLAFAVLGVGAPGAQAAETPGDDVLWVMGGQTAAGVYANDVWCSPDQGATWVEVTAAAPWSPRMNHQVQPFHGQLWLIGGNTADGNASDIWRTTGEAHCAPDGLQWELVTADAPWGTRAAGSTIVYHDQLWYLGGRERGVRATNDVWSSPDGVNWMQVTASASWEERDRAELVVLNDRLYLLAGRTGDNSGTYHHDVWSTTDGVTWVEDVDAAPWDGRRDFAAYVVGGRIYVTSGRQDSSVRFGDLWSSADGGTWQQEANPAWGLRYHVKVARRDGVLWTAGGNGRPDGSEGLVNDVWSSSDGITWTQVLAEAPWPARDHHQLVAFSNVVEPAATTTTAAPVTTTSEAAVVASEPAPSSDATTTVAVETSTSMSMSTASTPEPATSAGDGGGPSGMSIGLIAVGVVAIGGAGAAGVARRRPRAPSR